MFNDSCPLEPLDDFSCVALSPGESRITFIRAEKKSAPALILRPTLPDEKVMEMGFCFCYDCDESK
jgi:hypothetical protein